VAALGRLFWQKRVHTDPLGPTFVILRPDLFQPTEALNAGVASLLRDLRSQPSKPGTRVMAPGDPEKAGAGEHEAGGVPVDTTTWAVFQELAERYELVLPTLASAANP
jgi:ureidoglycolate dehydrogenase (NAD+)